MRDHTFRAVRFAGLGTGTLAVVVAVLLAFPVTAANVTPPTLTSPTLTRGGWASLNAKLAFCHGSLVLPQSAYLCERVVADSHPGAAASARGWVNFQMNETRTGLNGTHSFYELGFLNLSASWARLSLSCGAYGTAHARVYIFYHIWIWDETTLQYVSQSNSGYIWGSGPHHCPAGGGTVILGSPTLVRGFNTSRLASTGATSFTFVGTDTYTFTLFVGCTARADSHSSLGPTTAVASCNLRQSSSETMTIDSLVVV